MGLYDRDYGKYGEQTPWDRAQNPKSIVIILIVVTVAIWFVDLLMTNESVSVLFEWGAVSEQTLLRPWLWFQFLTYGFLHATQGNQGLMHVGFNMLGLFLFGRILEPRLGRGEFLRFYLVAIVLGGIVASLWAFGAVSLLGDQGLGFRHTIGASGAVVAIVVLFACYYPNQELLLFFVLPVKAWIVAIGFIAYNIFGALGVDPESRTAFQVHLTGAAFAYAYYKLRWNLGWLDPSRFASLSGEVKRRSRAAKLKLHDPDRKLENDAKEADRILDKIHREGEESLTSAERKTLERYSRRQRQRRDRSE